MCHAQYKLIIILVITCHFILISYILFSKFHAKTFFVSILLLTSNVQFQKNPYCPHRRDWNFLGGGGFCKAKKFKEMYEA